MVDASRQVRDIAEWAKVLQQKSVQDLYIQYVIVLVV